MQRYIYGQGKHFVEFDCRESTIEIRTNSLKGVTRILRRFKRATKEFKKIANIFTRERAEKDAKPHSYNWLVAHCRRCRLYLAGENESALTFFNVITNHN